MNMWNAWKVPRNYEAPPRTKTECGGFLDKAGEIRYKSAGIDRSSVSMADGPRLLAAK